MTSDKAAERITSCHVLAMPYPGRGHINPMMNLCNFLATRNLDLLITFVVTEEWLGFIGSEPIPNNIRFAPIPNVIPSELVRAKDFPGFVEAVSTKVEAPFDRLLDRLEPPVTAMVVDTYVVWGVRVGNKRNIPVASLWPMAASVFTVLYHFELLLQHQQFPIDTPTFSEREDEIVDYIPGISSRRLADLPTIFSGDGRRALPRALECVSLVSKAQYLLFTSFYELEPHAIDTLKTKFPFPVYTVGPTIPYFKVGASEDSTHNVPDCIQWLNSQPASSVLYISLGSFLSVSSSQWEEIVAGLRDSTVPYLLVARGDTSRIKDCCGDKGFVVPWCDQLKVLSHISVGGFWTHCGWSSTVEGVFAGVPMLTFPIFWDQVPNSRDIVEEWKIGRKVRDFGAENVVTKEEIAEIVRKFMDLESSEGKEMRQRSKEIQEKCRGAVRKGGSSDTNLDAFIRDISQGQIH